MTEMSNVYKCGREVLAQISTLKTMDVRTMNERCKRHIKA